MEKKPYYEEDFFSKYFSEKSRPTSVYIFSAFHSCFALIAIIEGLLIIFAPNVFHRHFTTGDGLDDILISLPFIAYSYWLIRRERRRNSIRKELNIVVKEPEPKINKVKVPLTHQEKRGVTIFYISTSVWFCTMMFFIYTVNSWDNTVFGLITIIAMVVFVYKAEKKKKKEQAEMFKN